MDYALGTTYRSFVVGWGVNPPLRVSSRLAPLWPRTLEHDATVWTCALGVALTLSIPFCMWRGAPLDVLVAPALWNHPCGLAAPVLVVQVQHAAASCPNLPAPCDWSNFDSPGPNPQVGCPVPWGQQRAGSCRPFPTFQTVSGSTRLFQAAQLAKPQWRKSAYVPCDPPQQTAGLAPHAGLPAGMRPR